MKESKIKETKKLKLIIILVLIFSISIITIGIIGIISSRYKKLEKENNEERSEVLEVNSQSEENNSIEVVVPAKKEITDWKLILVNKDNPLPQDYQIELSYIDRTRQFDKRAIGELNNMLKDMKARGVQNVWVQSAYRSVEYQQNLYDKSINKYLKQGKSIEEAEELTLEYLNKPRESEHNLGLAVDFNNVDEGFENTKAYEWLNKNAEDYGFILRYPEDKANITGIEYEPWHWRYVGKENAVQMNDLNMCLEEYIEYLEYGDSNI